MYRWSVKAGGGLIRLFPKFRMRWSIYNSPVSGSFASISRPEDCLKSQNMADRKSQLERQIKGIWFLVNL